MRPRQLLRKAYHSLFGGTPQKPPEKRPSPKPPVPPTASDEPPIPLWVPVGHFYSPVTKPSEVDAHFRRIAAHPPRSLPGITIDHAAMVAKWHDLVPFMRDAPFEENPKEGFSYGFENVSYSYGDGSVLHAMLRLHRPKRLIEVGSGYTSACTFDTVKHYLDGDCELTFIEPYPEVLKRLLKEGVSDVRIFGKGVQEVPLEVFDELQPGDFLFIDSTHLLKTGSDVCWELFEVLPRLASGVVIHFHDMFWPFEYPREWAVDENRSWNETYAMRAYLMHNDTLNVLFFNDYFVKLEPALVEETFPTFFKNSGGALWLERV